jgi:hypothetical protein
MKGNSTDYEISLALKRISVGFEVKEFGIVSYQVT